MRDDICILTPHFNFCGYKSNTENYFRWRDALPKDLKVFTGEVSLSGEFELNPDFGFKVDERYILWQKEAIINAMVAKLPENYRFIIWADHDFIFDNPYWLDMTWMRLNYDCDVVQCFSHIEWLNREGKPTQKAESSIFEAKKYYRRSMTKGAPGLVWAAKRDLFETSGGLDPLNIVGGGDRTFCEAVGRFVTEKSTRGMPLSLIRSNKEKTRLTKEHFHTCDYIPGKVSHLYHGEMKNRQYTTRYQPCCVHNFDPKTDIELDENLLPRWCTDKPELHKAIREYFVNRKEDDGQREQKSDRVEANHSS